MEKEAPTFYVTVKNVENEDRLFPPPAEEMRIHGSVIETYCDDVKTSVHRITFEEKRIRPEKSAIYAFIPNFRESREVLKECKFRIVLFRNPDGLPDERNIVIAFPGTESLP
jgi:hypothetical protein